MAKKKIAYIQFPGSNTENETKNILQKHGMLPFGHYWNDPSELLNDFDGFIILGGFSFEDRSRSGIIASLEPVVNELKKQALLGKPVLGICNGAQILVESGLVPGNKEFDTLVSLTDNKRTVGSRIVGTGYFNKWCYIKPCENAKSAFIKKDGKPMRVPIAHAEGRFLFNNDLEAEILKNNLITYKYCDPRGNLSNDFPTNPNGSLHSAAALSNPTGNVMAIMPHPERTLKNEVDDLFNLVNIERINANLDPLEFSQTLSDIADKYGQNMYLNGFWCHKDPNNGYLITDRLLEVGYPPPKLIGENLAMSSTIYSGHLSLMNSISHKETILDNEFNRIGIGIVSGPIGLIIVQIFS